MRYLVKIGELKQKIDFLEQQLSIIDENIDNLKEIKDSIVWEGEAYQTFNNRYEEYLKELTFIEEHVLSSIKYLLKYYNNYGTEYARLRSKYASLDREV